MSITENEEVPSTEAPVEASADASGADESAESAESEGQVEAEGTGVSDVAADEDESLDIEVEPDDEGEADGEAEGEVEVDPLAELTAQLAEAELGKKENYDRFVRTTADLENVRKRSRREVKDGRLDERGKVLRDMLPVLDNLERAVEHATQSENEATKSIIDGVQMVLRQFHQSLQRHNVTSLEAVGKPFDPAVHEAVSQAPSADHPPGTVISVLQTGYMMEDRLLRPALAVVSMAMPVAVVEDESEDEADPDEDAAEAEVEVESEDAAEVENATDTTDDDSSESEPDAESKEEGQE